MASLVGQIVQGRYRVTGRLGAGAMGTAYLAVDERGFERRVVLKVPQTDLLADEAIRKRFAREAQLLLTLKHPHIVNAFEVGEIVTAGGGTVPFVAMPYFEAGNLKERLRALGGVASASEVATWLPGLADALDYLHSEGVLHRDVKPANILFDQSNRSYAYLADFGIAKALSGDAASSLSVDGSVASAAYAPPEAWTSAWSPAFDQYSLAVVVFEALSGELPHVPVDSLLALAAAKVKPARLLSDVAPAVPLAVSQVLDHALATTPTKRYPSCRAFAEAFAQASLERQRVPPTGAGSTSEGKEPGTGTGNAPRVGRHNLSLAAKLRRGLGRPGEMTRGRGRKLTLAALFLSLATAALLLVAQNRYGELLVAFDAPGVITINGSEAARLGQHGTVSMALRPGTYSIGLRSPRGMAPPSEKVVTISDSGRVSLAHSTARDSLLGSWSFSYFDDETLVHETVTFSQSGQTSTVTDDGSDPTVVDGRYNVEPAQPFNRVEFADQNEVMKCIFAFLNVDTVRLNCSDDNDAAPFDFDERSRVLRFIHRNNSR